MRALSFFRPRGERKVARGRDATREKEKDAEGETGALEVRKEAFFKATIAFPVVLQVPCTEALAAEQTSRERGEARRRRN
jgi:hypothetical protein